MNNIERVNAVAQRLDELAEDGPSELTALADELGRVADSMQHQPVVAMNSATRPDWLQEIERLVEQSAAEIVAKRYGSSANANSPSITVSLPNMGYYQSVGNPKDAFLLGGVV